MRFSKKLVLAVAVVTVAACAYVFMRGGDDENKEASEVYAKVIEGPLVISVEESGEIAPSQQLVIKSEVEGKTTIISLVPEGAMVKKGDVLIELDVSDKKDELVNQDITLQNAESALVVAQENLDITKNQADSDVELAEQDYTFAEEDLVKYREGEYPNTLSEKLGSVTMAEQQVQQAKDKYDWSKKLYEENFLSESELRSDELSWKSQKLSLETAKGNLELLRNFTYKRELAKYQSDMKQKKMALERTKKKAISSVKQSESDLRAKERERNRQKQKYDKLVEQIAHGVIKAPMDGQVIYATSGGRRFNREPLQEGQDVWERQELIYLPTADTFIAKINVHESSLKNLVIGQPVRVTCDAMPGKVFLGKLSKIAPMPDNERRWMNPDLKEYPSEIELDAGKDELKSGMSCKAEIIIAQYDKAVYIPVQAVVRVAGKACVWVKGSEGPVEREIEVGMDNNRFVRVVSGLAADEEVLLNPPLASSVNESDVTTVDDGKESEK